ncbi:MAG: M3 family metallopeptidase [Hyphomonadaceae bacterium]|nr:M3 family metallopeptidase [Hyphomonadaceae bacterium]
MRNPVKLTLASVLALNVAACAPAEKTIEQAATQTMDWSQSQSLITETVTGDILLDSWAGPHGGVPPWDQVDTSKMSAALNQAIDMAKAEIEKVADNPDAPTFDNTIVALEKSGAALDRAGTIFGVHASNLNVDPIPAVLKEMSPKFAALGDSVTQNAALFARVKSIYDNMEGLNTEQKRLVDDYYQDFVRGGANLNDEDKAKMSEINGRLATLTTQFGQNVLADEQGYVTYITDEKDLAGLSDGLISSMAAAAKARDKEGQWAITNTRSSMSPFLTQSENRALREKVWNTYYNRGDNGDANDNNAIITEILQLRDQRAKLLGYKTHAHWKLENQMARTPENAIELMEKIWPHAIARANEEVADMQAVADEEGADIKIKPWDYRYYAEKVRKAKYDLDSAEIKPYMQMEKLREGMFWSAGEIYGFDFKQRTDIPVFHEDVRVWEVLNKEDGSHVGLWYFDPYARPGKRSGAWMNAYRTQHKLDGKPTTVIVSNNSNFVKGADGVPTLISWDDAETLFHEFGHAIHGLNSKVTYPTLSGTAVSRDYVEFPSQLYEHWLTTPEVLNKFAVHYETGEPIPQALLDKIEKAASFNQGFATTEYLASALVDMKLHMAGGDPIDPDKFERETLEALNMPEQIVMRHRTPHFGHIFSGGYHAGYYSYLWADTLTADAAEKFKEAGSFYDKETAKSLHDNIMSVGNTIDPADGFRAFRGRDVSVDALMRDRGFAPKG